MSGKKFEPLDFAVKKDSETIRKEVLFNTLAMIRYRGHLNWNNATIAKFVKNATDDGEYSVKLDTKIKDAINGNENFNGKVVYIKIISQSVKSVRNNPTVSQFIKKHINEHKIIIFDDIVKKARYELKDTFPHTEVFRQGTLMLDLMSIDAAPSSCRVLNDEECKKLKKEYMVNKKTIQKIKEEDPMSEYLYARIGQIIKIQGKSENAIHETRYRMVF